MSKVIVAALLSAALTACLCGCGEYDEAKKDFKSGVDSMAGEFSEARSSVEEFVSGEKEAVSDAVESLKGTGAEKAKNAKALGETCRSFYDDVVTGELSKESAGNNAKELDHELPSIEADQSERKKYAAAFTIKDVLIYKGQKAELSGVCCVKKDSGGMHKGDFFYEKDDSVETSGLEYIKITEDTTLGSIYG